MPKVIALDIYGTVLATDDPDNNLPPSKGIERFFERCKKNGIKVVSTSDANPVVVKIDLTTSGVKLANFDGFYRLNQLPHKDYSEIIRDYGLTEPRDLLVIGDSDKDINGAYASKCNSHRVQQYIDSRSRPDFSLINI